MNGPLKIRSLSKFYPSLGILHNLLMGSRRLRLCVCQSHICFFVLGSDLKMPVLVSRQVSDLPFTTPNWISIAILH